MFVKSKWRDYICLAIEAAAQHIIQSKRENQNNINLHVNWSQILAPPKQEHTAMRVYKQIDGEWDTHRLDYESREKNEKWQTFYSSNVRNEY